ncbi:hypothetical protein BD408DRAFT_472935 [Parasitella parasitica]|nr:hypothetical protein BD408DRAFT_472935 [Parasitella parasitica]
MQIINKIETSYGRRIGTLVTCDFEADKDDVEICFIEFKKSKVTAATLQQQQNKNLRIDVYI